MKNTITLAISLEAIKREITAQCAWVDSTNLTMLPPIVNPTTRSDIDAVVSHGIDALLHSFSAYIAGSEMHDADILNMDMRITPLSHSQQTSLAHKFNNIIVYHCLHELYSAQVQANHITTYYREKLAYLLSSAKQLLAIMQ